MAEFRDLLIEVGTEELPPKALRLLSENFAAQVGMGLAAADLSYGQVETFATPRRLAVRVQGIPVRQPDREIQRRGPALEAAFDAAGRPTRAALGFARSCGVPVEKLQRLITDKGRWLIFQATEAGQSTPALLPAIVENALSTLPIPRRMRWGDGNAEFVRPVHWVVFLFGGQVVEAEILGVRAGAESRGHRFHRPGPLLIAEPSRYAALLFHEGQVVAEFARRREMIRRQVQEAAAGLGGSALMDEELLEEVTALVEWPVAIAGGFNPEFLELPAEALIATMQENQKYFPVVDDGARLMPYFITVSNIESRNWEAVRLGNERVLRPRLGDCAFFYKTDLQRTLESRLPDLKEVIFQSRLGSLFDKSQRVARLAAHIAAALGEPPENVALAYRAGLLCKCDLLTDMVRELPKLQGYMGREYARLSGEPEAVAVALEEVYRPRFSGDLLPATRPGQALAIADKLDTLVGIFGIDQAPTGDKDPFGLRRAAIGVLRILIESKLDLDLRALLDTALAEYGERLRREAIADQTFAFIIERLRAYFLEQGITPDVFSAVQVRQPVRPYDFASRVWAVHEFRQLPEAAHLAAANKRIQNILRQAGVTSGGPWDEALLGDTAERKLAASVAELRPGVEQLLAAGDYTEAMRCLAGLQEPVDAFFDTVLVLCDDESIRANRLALLNSIHLLFLETADISRLQPRGTEEHS